MSTIVTTLIMYYINWNSLKVFSCYHKLVNVGSIMQITGHSQAFIKTYAKCCFPDGIE